MTTIDVDSGLRADSWPPRLPKSWRVAPGLPVLPFFTFLLLTRQADMYADLRSRELAHRMREARLAAGLSLLEVAQRIGMSPGQLSRLETAQRPSAPLNVGLRLGLYQTAAAERDIILELARSTGDSGEDAPRRGYWVRPHDCGPPEGVATVRYAYRAAQAITCCDPAGIPAMVQAEEFMEAELRGRCAIPAEVARWAEARREHKEILFARDGPAVTVYLLERVVRTLPVGAAIRQSQCLFLSMLVGQGRVRVRIVPARYEGRSMGAGFSLLHFAEANPAVCVPCDTVTLILERDHVEPYRQRLGELNTIALSEQDSLRLITALANDSSTGQ